MPNCPFSLRRVCGTSRLRISSVSAAAVLLAVASASGVPQWSNQFAGRGAVYTVFDDGPVTLMAHQTTQGPRLFIGGEFSAIGAMPADGCAMYDGAAWHPILGISAAPVQTRVSCFSTATIGGIERVVVAGAFRAPVTGDGIGYLDSSFTLRNLPPAPRSTQSFAGIFGWQSPAGPEILLSVSMFPAGSEYMYRYSPSGYANTPPGVISVTTAYAQLDDGTGPAVYIGLPMAGGNFNQTVCRWNGTTLAPLPVGGPGWVNALCVHDDGTGPALYAGGNGVKRFRAGAWESLPGNPVFGVQALTSYDDGSGPALYVAGQMTTAGGVPVTNIGRLRAGQWEPLGSGLAGGRVNALAVFDEDGPGPQRPALYAAGKFLTAGGISSPGIARWGEPVAPRASSQPQAGVTCGSPLTFTASFVTVCTDAPVLRWQFRPGASIAWTNLAEGPLVVDGRTIASAAGSASASVTLTPIAGSGPWPAGSEVRCTMTNQCGSIATQSASVTFSLPCSLADLPINGACPDGTVDGSDFIAFINSFALGNAAIDPSADLVGGGDDGLAADGTIDGADFIAFVNAFALGC